MNQSNPIAETNNFIVLEKYIKQEVDSAAAASYQTEADLEREFIQDLVNQGYERLTNLNSVQAMYANARVQIETLNNMQFSNSEWARYVEEYLDKPSDNLVEKTRKIHNNHIYFCFR